MLSTQTAAGLLAALLLASANAQAPRYFKEWCDATTAQGMVSLAANRIFGQISTLSDDEYKARSAWTDNAYKLAAARFKALTGKDFMRFDIEVALPQGWMRACQLADQVR